MSHQGRQGAPVDDCQSIKPLENNPRVASAEFTKPDQAFGKPHKYKQLINLLSSPIAHPGSGVRRQRDNCWDEGREQIEQQSLQKTILVNRKAAIARNPSPHLDLQEAESVRETPQEPLQIEQ